MEIETLLYTCKYYSPLSYFVKTCRQRLEAISDMMRDSKSCGAINENRSYKKQQKHRRTPQFSNSEISGRSVVLVNCHRQPTFLNRVSPLYLLKTIIWAHFSICVTCFMDLPCHCAAHSSSQSILNRVLKRQIAPYCFSLDSL